MRFSGWFKIEGVNLVTVTPVLEVAYGSLVGNTYVDFNERMPYFFRIYRNNLKSKHSIYYEHSLEPEARETDFSNHLSS